ncbi:MAG: type VI secretion system membrane subunit TssM, partial [Pseudomonadota bacterium]
ERRHMLRGVYFTSGTQEGAPLDRLMMGMARIFGIGRQAIGSGRGTGRSYFLTRLFEDVMFPEAGLVAADDKIEKRYKITRIVAIAATVLVAAGIGALWVRSYTGNRALIVEAEDRVANYATLANEIPGSPIGDTDLPTVVPALNILRDMPGNPVLADPAPERALRYGLYQGKIVGTQAAQSYRSALNQHLLPRMLLRLEEQIAASMNEPELLYETLKIYLMLGLQGPIDQKTITEWMTADWQRAYPGIANEPLRNNLNDHLTALLRQEITEIPLNGPLVKQAQGVLAQMPVSERIYNGIINSVRAQELPRFRLTNAGGPAVSRVMVRASGKPLNDGIEGIFTRRGFYEVFVDEAARAAFRLKNEAWVLGPEFTSGQAADILPVQRDVLQLYYADYIARYDALLSDINIVPLENASQATEVTNVLSGPVSPIVNILTEVSAETRLTGSDTVVNTSGLQEGLSNAASIEINSLLSVQGQALLASIQRAPLFGEEGQTPPPVGFEVEQAFSWLHQLTFREDNQPSQLDLLMDQLKVLNQELSKMVFSGDTSAPEAAAAIQQFQAAAAQFDGPLPRWANQVSVGSTGIATTGTRASINQRWQSSILPFCQQALTSRYPFDRRARDHVPMQDFQRLFAPGGMIDSFFKESLATYVDTTQPEWVSKRVNNTDLGLSPEALKQMQRAVAIRDAFFSGTSDVPSIRFQMTPEALDPQATRVAIDIDGTIVEYLQGTQPSPQSVTWPGTVGVARVSFEPLATNVESTFGRDGPWAWFRLLDAAEVRKTNVSDRRRVIFNVGGRISIFQLQTPSSLNPFALPALSNFACPESF